MHRRPDHPFLRARLRYDSTFRIECEYCYEHAIPHSVFLGRTVGPEDPAWTELDREKMIATAMERSERCSQCGTAQWEWDADPTAYTAIRQSCPGCYYKDRERTLDNAPTRPGETVVLIPRAQAERIRATPAKRPASRRERNR